MSGFDIELDELSNIIVGGTGTFKYDLNGNLIWFNMNVGCNVIALDNMGNTYTTAGNFYYATRKISSSGAIIWEEFYPKLQFIDPNRPKDLCIDKEGRVLVTGQCREETGSINDYATVKYSNSGDLIWERRYNGGNEDAAYAITSDASNNVYVTGWNSNITTDILTIKIFF
ncbi:MAG: hypothetical protein IPL53_20570 [Ignavibacteria bacterium]|nr:hypothetical protein [Ignavibacteria bacterium]